MTRRAASVADATTAGGSLSWPAPGTYVHPVELGDDDGEPDGDQAALVEALGVCLPIIPANPDPEFVAQMVRYAELEQRARWYVAKRAVVEGFSYVVPGHWPELRELVVSFDGCDLKFGRDPAALHDPVTGSLLLSRAPEESDAEIAAAVLRRRSSPWPSIRREHAPECCPRPGRCYPCADRAASEALDRELYP